MADNTDVDPLDDYDPGRPLFSDENDESDYGTEPDLTDAQLQDLDVRDYRHDDLVPTSEYGTYEEHYPDSAEDLRHRSAYHAADHAQASEDGRGAIEEKVVETLRNCFAAMHGRNGGEMVELVSFTLSSTQVMAYLEEAMAKTYARLSEIFVSEYADDKSRVVDLHDIPGIEAASGKVQGELVLIQSRLSRPDLPKTPSSTWKALVNYVQRVASRDGLMELAGAINTGETDELCMGLFRTLEPPSANKALVNAEFSRTAKEWEEADIAAAAESSGIRLSSGYPTLDYALTLRDGRNKDMEPRGSFAPGEFHIMAAPTGNGKSAAARMLIRNTAEDLVVGWGREHDKVLIAITEEAPKIVYTMAGMASGQPFHHLASNLVIANVGASRERVVHAVWDLVIAAYHRSQETGVPIANAGLPSMIVVDYLGGLLSQGEAETHATERTANFILRGLCNWDVLGMETFTGESFAAYAGMSWPDGMDNFKPVVIGFAQFVKLKDPLWYDPNGRGVNVEDFMIPNADGSPGWEVLPGDFRLPTQTEIRGSGVQANHATGIMIFHRSRPQKNAKVVDPATGKVRLSDDRARWILVKTRNGSNVPFVDMRFDSHSSGLRGQFFDRRAEEGVALGRLIPTESYREEGDPILPKRPRRTPFDGVAY